MIPKLIKGGFFEDKRGSISYMNDFKFDEIERFYIITNSEGEPFRAWQGHKLDCKNFYCISGSFRIHYIKIDNWKNPSKKLKIESLILKASDHAVLKIPAGYANGVEALELGSKLLVFATLPLDKAGEDDVRFDKEYWKINDQK